jgi:hypothetical protein
MCYYVLLCVTRCFYLLLCVTNVLLMPQGKSGKRAEEARGDFSRAGSPPNVASLHAIVPFFQRLSAHRLDSACPYRTRPAQLQSFRSSAHAHHCEPPPGRTAMCVSVCLQVCSLPGAGVSPDEGWVALVAFVSSPLWTRDSCVVGSLPEVSLPPEGIRVIEGGGGVVDSWSCCGVEWAASPLCETRAAVTPASAMQATASRSTCQ